MSSYKICSKPVNRLTGTTYVPGDKSISHRALILATAAEGASEIKGFLASADCLATMQALRSLGVTIKEHNGLVQVNGRGRADLSPSADTLDLGNSGTAIRLLCGLLVGRKISVALTGDASLVGRPMQRVVEPLQAMGADILASVGGTPPISIRPVDKLNGMSFELPVASAQVKSALLLAGLQADGKTTVAEPSHSRDHTERMLEAFGCTVEKQGLSVAIHGQSTLKATQINIPGDISSAAFFVVAACIIPDSDITIKNIGLNPTRIGAIEILRMMGADIEILSSQIVCCEPVGDLRIRTSQLRGIDIPSQLVASAIDEFPVLFIAASCADGKTYLRGAAELRYKESDRIETMAEGLRACGIAVEIYDDGILIQGGHLKDATVNSHDDHRVAMAFAIAGATSDNAITVENCQNITTSFPNFVETANKIGLSLSKG